MNEEDCGLFMLPDSRDNSKDLRIVDQLSIVTSHCIVLLPLSLFLTDVTIQKIPIPSFTE